jgi:HEAT repeat protein
LSTVEEILKSKLKPKEKTTLLASSLKNDSNLIFELIEYCKKASASAKGACIEAIEYVTKEDPVFAKPALNFVFEHVNDKLPRVRMESARVIANTAKEFPAETANAVPNLLANTKDEGTVVRWAAAYALTEIAKYNKDVRKKLIKKFEKIVLLEDNNGVKNIYLKALKKFQKGEKE